MIRVVAGVAKDGENFLVARRPFHKNFGGKWEFPGGKVECGETDAEALSREFMEEFSVGIEIRELIHSEKFIVDTTSYEIAFYKILIQGGYINPNEHIDFKFLKKEDLKRVELCPSDKKLLNLL